MSENAKKEINELRRKLKQHGIDTLQLPNGHWRTDSDPPLTFSFSPSDTNAARAAYRDVKKKLGIDLALPRKTTKRKSSTNDFAMQRLRERVLKQMERGATAADLARLAVAASEDKRIGGWPNTNTAEVGIANCLRGGRLVKQNHDSLAAAVGKLEHASDDAFAKHLDSAADRFGKKRGAKPVEPEPEPTHHPAPQVELEDESNLEALSPEAHAARHGRRIDPALIAEANGKIPAKVEVTIKIELGEETRQLIESLIGTR